MKNSLGPLVSPALGKEAHWAAACQATHPFTDNATLPADGQFAATHSCRLGEAIVAWRRHQLGRISELRSECEAVDISLHDRMIGLTTTVIKDLRVCLCMVLGLIILWPDGSLPHRFVSGLNVVGHAASSN